MTELVNQVAFRAGNWRLGLLQSWVQPTAVPAVRRTAIVFRYGEINNRPASSGQPVDDVDSPTGKEGYAF